MKWHRSIVGGLAVATLVWAIVVIRASSAQPPAQAAMDPAVADNARRMLDEGRRVFRYETFGDEAYWGDTLKLHRAIAGAKLGGVGPGVSPKTALSVGLKVDVDSVPAPVAAALKAGKVDLDDPASTLVLLKANAVVGLTGHFDAKRRAASIGVQCALCHSTVDDSFAPGIGHRLDGWANRDLNVGAIVSLAPDLSAITSLLGVDEPTVKKVLASWGPGKFDAQLNLDGKAFRPDGKSAATLIPPAYGLAGVNLHTWGGGWGTVTYWNAFVANLELNGRGNFFDARLDNAQQYPVAAKARLGHKTATAGHGHAASRRAALLPDVAAGSGGQARIVRHRRRRARGKSYVCGKGPLRVVPRAAALHRAGWNTHKAAEIGIDDFQANRSPDKSYRTAPLRGLMAHAKGGFYHDGRFADLAAVVDHYDQFFKLALTDAEKRDLIEYLKSL